MGTYDSRDYYGAALEAFTSWCANKYMDPEFKEASQLLKQYKIGVDLIGNIGLDVLTNVCGISHSTALRLKSNLAKWKASL